ncbi:MAG: kelch repeat-containing protein, partial [Myxococcota bacterium]
PALESVSMAYHPDFEAVLMFGGRVPRDIPQEVEEVFTNTLWSWDTISQAWTRIDIANPPEPRANAGMVFDAQRRRLVLVGGDNRPYEGLSDQGGTVFGDTWELDLALGDRPNIGVQFDAAQIGVSPDTLAEVRLSATLGGEGLVGDTPTDGVEWFIWNQSSLRWEEPLETPISAGIDAPQSTTITLAVSDDSDEFVADGFFYTKARPVGANGLTTAARVVMAAPVLTVTYRLPEGTLAPASAGTP